MSPLRIATLIAIASITGCSSSGNTHKTAVATSIVEQTDPSKILRVDISALHDSYLQANATSSYDGKIVEVTGDVISFSMKDDKMYQVTLQAEDEDAVCFFDDSISGKLGDGRPIYYGANLTVQGQCASSGLFSSTPFTLDGCRIVSK